MLLFGMTTISICPSGEDRMDVTVRSIVNGEIEYMFVKRVYESIVRLEYGVKSTWPDADNCRWLTTNLKVTFFDLSHLLLGWNFLSAIHSLSFPNMRVPLNKTLRIMVPFQCVTIVNRIGRLAIHGDDGIKLVAMVLCFKHEANLKEAIGTPQQILASICTWWYVWIGRCAHSQRALRYWRQRKDDASSL